MIGASDLAYYVYGTWRLMRRDAGAIQYFPNTREAFWRSFQAAIIVAPFFAIILATHLSGVTTKGSPAFVVAVALLIYVIGWLLFPMVMLYISEALNRREYYFRYIAANNWAAILQSLIFFAVFLIGVTGLLPKGVMGTLFFVTEIALYVYFGYIARVGLDVSIRAAVGIVVLDFVISHLLQLTLFLVIGVPQPETG